MHKTIEERAKAAGLKLYVATSDGVHRFEFTLPNGTVYVITRIFDTSMFLDGYELGLRQYPQQPNTVYIVSIAVLSFILGVATLIALTLGVR